MPTSNREEFIKNKIGIRKCNKQGLWFEIIEYKNCQDITIRFDNGEELKVNGNRILAGNILPPSQKKNIRKNERHGDRYTKLWKEWNTMLWRCNPKNKRHHVWYSDKGINVCEEWQKYTSFKEWALNNGFEENLTIDRIDEKIDYCPQNCRWITLSENVKRISESKSWVAVNKYDLNNIFIESFKSISSASRSLNGATKNKIKRCCDGKENNYMGYIWKYENK